MSEFKFACPVCGQRMAVDSSATGAQVECPTCFQIIIVPKAPAEGSKYQLSATQYIRPVILPPPPKPPPVNVTPQKKSAVLIFGLILICAVVMALFVREKIAGPRQQSATPAGTTNSAPVIASPLWTLDLTNVNVPDQEAAGEIHGQDFVCRQAIFLQNGVLILQSAHGWQSPLSAGISVSANFFSTNAAEVVNGRSFEVGTNHSGPVPSISLFWQEGNMRVMEMFTNGFAMKLEFEKLSSNKHKLPGKIYLCLPDGTRSYIVGTFTAEVRKFPRPPRRPHEPH